MSLKSLHSRLSYVLAGFIHALISSIFEMKPVMVPVRATFKPRGYGRPVTEILFTRHR